MPFRSTYARSRAVNLAPIASLADIETRADCERLVRAFYGRALTDPIIGYLFTDVARLDLEAHVPRLTNFWQTILLGAHSYGGGAFRPHLELHFKAPLQKGHFDRWLFLWRMSVDELFSGPHAELAKAHAERVAQAFQNRLRSFDEEENQVDLNGLPMVQHYAGRERS
ncbi:MAG TPA: group III truncated hemoglobin [Solirubrobacteraceae bacterium]|nr:group III truncated hemoglobin [Solirubrobacteraceae bacterium]